MYYTYIISNIHYMNYIFYKLQDSRRPVALLARI